jgi:hypothetical protein
VSGETKKNRGREPGYNALVTIELTRKHVALFTLLLSVQTLGLWMTFTRYPALAGMPRSIWAYFFLMVPGSAFLTTIILMELVRALHPKKR